MSFIDPVRLGSSRLVSSDGTLDFLIESISSIITESDLLEFRVDIILDRADLYGRFQGRTFRDIPYWYITNSSVPPNLRLYFNDASIIEDEMSTMIPYKLLRLTCVFTGISGASAPPNIGAAAINVELNNVPKLERSFSFLDIDAEL